MKMFHVAIIMDGNGRWARRRRLPREAGHREGAGAVRRIVEAAVSARIDILTLYAFSSDNWKRPPAEVQSLMQLLRRYLEDEKDGCVENGVRVNVIGRRDRLTPGLVHAIEKIEAITSAGRQLHLRLAIDYSGRQAILDTATRFVAGDASDFAACMSEVLHAPTTIPDVDLLIRSGGEHRLSDFLLWECAYAEFVFVACLWPDFDEAELTRAISSYLKRERRFGQVPGRTGGRT